MRRFGSVRGAALLAAALIGAWAFGGPASAATIEGVIRAMVEPETVGDPQIPLPVPHTRVVLDGVPGGHTDSEGRFSFDLPDSADHLLSVGLSGLYCDIVNDGGPSGSITAIVWPGEPAELLFDATNSHVAERDAYSHVNRIHDWIVGIDPAFTALDYPVTVHVNNGFATCGASWSPAGLIFYREGGGCNNTGRISDVVYHEYAHGITRALYAPQNPPVASGMDEAYSDIAAMTINNDPEIAEYFIVGDPNGIRTGENLRQYPGTECGGNPFCLSEILSGAMWKLRESLNLLYGDEAGGAVIGDLHIRTLKGRPTTLPAYLHQLLVNDDDDGDLANGTPHWWEICGAFGQHNLPCPPLNNDLVEGDRVEPLGIVAVRPNPSRGACAIDLDLGEANRVTAEIFDAAGRRVRRFVDAPFGAGSRSIAWDGRTEWGAPAAPGVYLLRVRCGAATQERSIVLIP